MTPTNPPAKHPPPQKVFRYVTLRDGYTWYSEQDRECDPSVNEKTTYVPAALLQEERNKMEREVHVAVLAMAEICTKEEFIEYMKRVVAQAARSPGDAEKEKKNDTTQVL